MVDFVGDGFFSFYIMLGSNTDTYIWGRVAITPFRYIGKKNDPLIWKLKVCVAPEAVSELNKRLRERRRHRASATCCSAIYTYIYIYYVGGEICARRPHTHP